MQSLHLLSTPVASPDTAPLAVLRLQRPSVVHGRRLIGHARFPFLRSLSAHMTVPEHQPSSVAQRVSNDRVTNDERFRLICGTGVRTFLAVGERGLQAPSSFSSRAPKSIATFRGMWFTRYPVNEERAALNVLTPAASGSGHFSGAVGAEQEHHHVNPGNNLSTRVVVALASSDAGAIDTTVAAQGGRRLIDWKPLGGAVELGQVENRTYRLAGNVTDIRRKFMRIAVADGVVTDQEDAISRDLQALEVALEQKADDERAAFALIRAGRTKHTRGIVVDLFPAIGPNEAA